MLAGYGEGYDFFTLKGKVERLLAVAGVSGYDVTRVDSDPSYHPGRTALISIDGQPLVKLGEIHPDVTDNYAIGAKVYVAEIDYERLYAVKNTVKLYQPLPKYPAMTRDLAFVCEKATPVLQLEKLISEAVGGTLESIDLFDVYEGIQIGANKKSVAFSLVLRAADRTLTDEEADAAVKRAIERLRAIGAELRG